MYYITNHNDQIIAADESLLKSLDVENIDDLIKKVLLEKISFTKKSSSELQITTSRDTHSYTMRFAYLSSMLGSLNLIHLESREEHSIETTDILTPENGIKDDLVENIQEEAKDEIQLESETASTLLSKEDSFLIDDSERKELSKPSTKEDLGDISNPNKDELFDLSLPNEIIPNSDVILNDTITTPEIDDSELFNLILPEVATDTLDDIVLDSEEDAQESLSLTSAETPTQSESLDTSPIVIHIQEVSEDIGISNEDYKTFLNDYIDTAISLEDELQSTDQNERLSAVDTLTQLAYVLQLPKVNNIIQKISTTPENELSDLVESLYHTLSRLTTKEENVNTNTETSTETLPDFTETKDIPLEKEIIHSPIKNGFGKIYLEDVKPIHFDFQLEAAANDLSLPVELIEEFVHDFIEQGHSETKKMLQAYEEGDLDTIQKIGHLLKGASSNLRINALSDTLYDIQFCEDSNKLEDYIERYWAHFLSFEQQIDMITK